MQNNKGGMGGQSLDGSGRDPPDMIPGSASCGSNINAGSEGNGGLGWMYGNAGIRNGSESNGFEFCGFAGNAGGGAASLISRLVTSHSFSTATGANSTGNCQSSDVNGNGTIRINYQTTNPDPETTSTDSSLETNPGRGRVIIIIGGGGYRYRRNYCQPTDCGGYTTDYWRC